MNNAIEDVRKSIEEIISETDEVQLLLYTVEEDIQMLRKGNARLKAENAKLRALVQDMHECMKLDCDTCRHKNKRHEWGACELYVKEGGFTNRIRALGIEVNE